MSSKTFSHKLERARIWRKDNKDKWFKVLESHGFMDLESLDVCETKVSVRACSLHPNEHPHVFTTHHCDSPFCPVCTVRRWERETIDIQRQLEGVSNRYFHLVFTLPQEVHDQVRSSDELKKFRKVVKDSISSTLGGVPGGVMSVHLSGDNEPGKHKPHIHVLLPAAVILPDGTVKRFSRVPEDVLKYEYHKRLSRWFKGWNIPKPVVHIKWFTREKLFHRSRYLVHLPFEISDLELPDEPGGEVKVTVTGNGTQKKVGVPGLRIVRSLLRDRNRGHRYQWFGFMSYNSRERYRAILYIPGRVKPGKKRCSVCDSPTYHVGYLYLTGHFEVNLWMPRDFMEIYRNERVYEEFKRSPPPGLVLA